MQGSEGYKKRSLDGSMREKTDFVYKIKLVAQFTTATMEGMQKERNSPHMHRNKLEEM